MLTYVHSRVIQSGTETWMTQCPELLQCHPGTEQATAEVEGEATQSHVGIQKHLTGKFLKLVSKENWQLYWLSRGRVPRYVRKNKSNKRSQLVYISAWQSALHVDQWRTDTANACHWNEHSANVTGSQGVMLTMHTWSLICFWCLSRDMHSWLSSQIIKTHCHCISCNTAR